MDPLWWWIILILLLGAVTLLLLYFCKVLLKSQSSSNSKSQENDVRDIDDLTNIERKYPAIGSTTIVFQNEVVPKKTHRRGSSVSVNPRKNSLLLVDVHESISDCYLYSVDDIINEVKAESANELRRGSFAYEGSSSRRMSRKSSLKSELTSKDDIEKEFLTVLQEVTDEATTIEREIDCFLGEIKNLTFYDIMERLIRLGLVLSHLECKEDELRKRKKETLKYIDKCKEKLNSKISGNRTYVDHCFPD
ncbi:hypothetical protein ABEB36_008885 [Hypothenemus hampei]|uniref:BAG domain-containing protein n=1 Tax=Hypothenemus hampei TaxID=57062 RepID=A0ABD1ESE6_HYPHA